MHPITTLRYWALSRSFLVVLVVLFVASVAIPKGQDVLLINGHHAILLDVIFAGLTNLGDGIIFLPIAVFCLFIRFRYAIMAVLLSIGHGLFVTLFKRALFPGLERPRKFLGDELIHFVPGIDVHNLNSFPSGHTATAFCAALFIALISRNRTTGMFVLILALLVGYSRVYLAQHFLMDVAAGAIIGCFTAYSIWQIMETAKLPRWMNRKLRLKSKRAGNLNRA
jgi:membrane-associated phospholipid phosphatase